MADSTLLGSVNVHDVVQIAPDFVNEQLRGCFAVVTRIGSWGVQADVPLDATRRAPVRLAYGTFEWIGRAVWWR